MIRKILSVTTLCFILTFQTQMIAQNLKSEANFWIKGSDSKSVVNLNGNYPISDDNQGAIMMPLGADHSNFYVVFQSFDAHEVDLASVQMKCFQQNLTTQNINPQSLDVPLLEKIQTGAILKYGFNLGNYQVTDDFVLLNNDKDRTYIYEMIYVNREFTDIDHKYLQTYLSLKYGVSLLNVNNYLSHENEVLWNPNISIDFNKNIIGLGKSNFYELNQFSSKNSVDQLLTISSNSLKNEEYVLIGNNANANRFVNNGNEMILEKQYLAQTKAKGEKTISLRFNLSMLENYDVSKSVHLNINDEDKIEGKIDKNEIIFSDVVLNSNGNGIDYLSLSYDLSSIKADLADAWFLNKNGQLTIKPEIITDNQSNYSVAWYFNNKLISNKTDLVTDKTGIYEMRITSKNTTNSYQTTVYNQLESSISNEITVYPNPIEVGQDFKVSYNLGSESNVEISIYQLDGKLVTNQKLGRFNQQDFVSKLEAAGVYMIISKIDGKANINKIIVK